jgi:hypothetical protein
MKNKIITEDWKIAFNLWFLFMLVFQFFICGFVFSYFVNIFNINYYLYTILDIFFTPLVYIVGSIVVSKLIKNKYQISNPIEIVRLSTYLLLVVSGGARIYSFVLVLFINRNWISIYLTLVPILTFFIGLFVFYNFSKIYIKK